MKFTRHTVSALRLTPLAIASLAGLAQPAFAQERAAPPRTSDRAPAAAPASLPIRTITLYRSGVGYFERRGTVDAGDKTSLHFATDQINDMLKSMVILDPQQALESVSYGSKEPLARRLAAFGINIADEPTLAAILGRIRGTKARFVTPDGTVAGVVLGVESRPQAQGSAQEPISVPYANVVTEQGIRSVNLSTIASVELADKDLNAELMKALSAIAEHQADRVKTVDLTFGGNGARPVVVAYVSEMPIWKTSYRLVLPDQPEDRKDPKEQGGLPTIQGWAIVENTTDEDWENVRLGLVAGRPVSFQMDLYEPLYVGRPTVAVPTVPGVMPRVYEDAAGFETNKSLEEAGRQASEGRYRYDVPRIDLQDALKKSQGGGGNYGLSPFRALNGQEPSAAQKPVTADDLIRYSAAARAGGGEIGEVFEYTLKTPVSIARQRSAMLPILASAINGRRVSIFNRADGAEHPMRGVELTNSTGLQLIPGPISVFDGAAYAGDAQIGHITTGDKRLLAYAVDLDVQALVKEESQANVRSIKIVSGLIQQTSKQVSRVKYAFANKDTKRPRQILIEQPKTQGWDLVEPKKPAEETTDLYRFELTVAPGAAGTLDVAQERTDVQSFAVTQYDFNTLLAYAKDGRASKAVVDAVKHAADLQAAATETERRIKLLTEERQTIDQDQARIRQNMAAVARDTDLYRRYTTRLNEQETRLEAIRDQNQKETDTLTQQRRDLDAFVRSLNVE